jgi:hypothetical protein
LSIAVLLAAAIERFYDLNVGITPLEEGAPHERPRKPLLLLAAFDLSAVASKRREKQLAGWRLSPNSVLFFLLSQDGGSPAA